MHIPIGESDEINEMLEDTVDNLLSARTHPLKLTKL